MIKDKIVGLNLFKKIKFQNFKKIKKNLLTSGLNDDIIIMHFAKYD